MFVCLFVRLWQVDVPSTTDENPEAAQTSKYRGMSGKVSSGEIMERTNVRPNPDHKDQMFKVPLGERCQDGKVERLTARPLPQTPRIASTDPLELHRTPAELWQGVSNFKTQEDSS